MTSDPQNEKKMPLVSQRPTNSDDHDFLYELYRSTRREEVEAWGLAEQQLDMLLTLQFTARNRHYDIAFPDSDHQIILCEGRPIGRILLYRSPIEIRLVDIALLPDYRRGGIGSMLVRGLCDESAADGRPITLHVAKTNPAVRLYSRLGFAITGDIGTDYKMEWQPH